VRGCEDVVLQAGYATHKVAQFEAWLHQHAAHVVRLRSSTTGTFTGFFGRPSLRLPTGEAAALGCLQHSAGPLSRTTGAPSLHTHDELSTHPWALRSCAVCKGPSLPCDDLPACCCCCCTLRLQDAAPGVWQPREARLANSVAVQRAFAQAQRVRQLEAELHAERQRVAALEAALRAERQRVGLRHSCSRCCHCRGRAEQVAACIDSGRVGADSTCGFVTAC
jgi:hypothetical protein